MKNFIFICGILLYASVSKAQSVTESKDGKNSILLNGSAITLNITEPTLRLDFQKKSALKKNGVESRNNSYLLGLSAEGKNQSGVANIFSEGNLVPSGRLTGLAGLVFTNNVISDYQQKLDEVKNRMKSERARQALLIEEKKELKKEMQDTTTIQKLIDRSTTTLTALNNEKREIAGAYAGENYHKLIGFFYGGISAKSFKRFVGYDSDNLLKSFKTQNFRGNFLGLGLNYQYRNWMFGATAERRKDDNQALLSQEVYDWQRITTTGNQTIVESKEIKAYSGAYATVSYFLFNADVVANISLDPIKSVEKPRNYMLINPYLHAKIGSSDKDLLPNTTDAGLGLYIFNDKSKLLGGVFLELPDINDKIEKSKIATDRNIRPALQKLSFGIVTRFNLQSFMKFQNL